MRKLRAAVAVTVIPLGATNKTSAKGPPRMVGQRRRHGDKSIQTKTTTPSSSSCGGCCCWKVPSVSSLLQTLIPILTLFYGTTQYLLWTRHDPTTTHDDENDHHSPQHRGRMDDVSSSRRWRQTRREESRSDRSGRITVDKRTEPSIVDDTDTTTVTTVTTNSITNTSSNNSVPLTYTCFNGTSHTTWRNRGPDFIIAGTQKGGTTALYALLRKHPRIRPSTLFEGHFFDMHYGVLKERLSTTHLDFDVDDDDRALHCRMYQAYVERLGYFGFNQSFFRDDVNDNADNDNDPQQRQQRIWTFEKTPNYMIWPHVPAAIVATCPWKPKIIMVLRNPVDRLYSQYRMNARSTGSVPSDDDDDDHRHLVTVLNDELVRMRRFGLSHAPNVSEWIAGRRRRRRRRHDDASAAFDPPFITQHDRDAKDSIRFRGYGNHGGFHRYLLRGMYVYQLRRWFRHFDPTDREQVLVLSHESLVRDMGNAWRRILAFVGAPHHELSDRTLVTRYRPALPGDDDRGRRRSVEGGGGRTVPPPPSSSAVHDRSNNDTRAYLVEFFRPYNALLADLLGDEWRGIWDE